MRFSAKAVIPSRKSSEAKHDSRSSISSRSCSGVSRGKRASVSIACLLPVIESGALAAISAASSSAAASTSSSSTDLVDEPDPLGALGVDVAAGQEQLARAATPIDVDEALEAGVAVDQAELRRRHPELRAGGADPQVAADRELEARRRGSGR